MFGSIQFYLEVNSSSISNIISGEGEFGAVNRTLWRQKNAYFYVYTKCGIQY